MVFMFGIMIAYGMQITLYYLYNQYDLGVKGQGHINIKSVENCIMIRNAKYSFVFKLRLFIFGTMVAHGV